MRRKDRQVTDALEIAQIMDDCKVCRLGLADGNTPYVVPLNYGYELTDGKFTVYLHAATQGRKLDIIARNPRVCFEADGGHALIRADSACSYSYAYASVIGFGKAEVLADDTEKCHAMEMIMRHQVGKDFSIDAQMLRRTAVIRIRIDEISGKRNPI